MIMKYIVKIENTKNIKMKRIHTLKDDDRFFYTRYSIISLII